MSPQPLNNVWCEQTTGQMIVSLCAFFQYYYSVRIFPGQEPSSVWVGWVTSDFHQYDAAFQQDKVRTVTVTLGDEKGKVHERFVEIHFLKCTCVCSVNNLLSFCSQYHLETPDCQILNKLAGKQRAAAMEASKQTGSTEIKLDSA